MSFCSFCGKRDDEVIVLVAGPSVFICDECVDLCATIVQQWKTPIGPVEGYAQAMCQALSN